METRNTQPLSVSHEYTWRERERERERGGREREGERERKRERKRERERGKTLLKLKWHTEVCWFKGHMRKKALKCKPGIA